MVINRIHPVRLRRRYERVRFILLRRLLLWGSGLGVGLFLIWTGDMVILKGDLFKLYHLKVSGNQQVRAQDIEALFRPVLQRNLLTLDLDPWLNQALDHPWVQGVRIRKVLPHTLLVHLQERTPVAVVESREGLYWVDASGMVLGALPEGSESLPRITGVHLEGLVRRDPTHLNRLKIGLALIEAVQRQPVSGPSQPDLPGPIIADLKNGVKDPRLYVQGYRVRFGEGNFREKWKNFLDVYQDLKARGLASEEIDLRFTDQVIVKTF